MKSRRHSGMHDATGIDGGRSGKVAVPIDLLARLKNVSRSGEGWTARCPAHADNHSSLSIHHRSGRWLIYCHAGCRWRAIIEAIGIEAAELFDKMGRERGS
jgi:putative DNA primase/helicase